MELASRCDNVKSAIRWQDKAVYIIKLPRVLNHSIFHFLFFCFSSFLISRYIILYEIVEINEIPGSRRRV
jgi:hypothetical protein